MKQTKMTRLSDKPQVHHIQPRVRARRTKYTDAGAYDPDYEVDITIVLESQDPIDVTGQDQDIIQEDAETESQSSDIDGIDTPGEALSDTVVAPQVDIVSQSPNLLMEESTNDMAASQTMPITGSPESVPCASVDASDTSSTQLATTLDEPSEPSLSSVSTTTSTSTSRATLPMDQSGSSSDSFLVDPTPELSIVEHQVFKAIMKLEWFHGEQGPLTRQTHNELCLQHARKGLATLEACYRPPKLQQAQGEPKKMQTPKSVCKRLVSDKVPCPFG